MTHLTPFATMRGMDILGYLRDAVADEAERKRGFIRDCEKYAEGSTSAEDRARIRALQSCADALTYLIVWGIEELKKNERNPDHKFPEHLVRLCNQARVALIEDHPDVPEKEEEITTG